MITDVILSHEDATELRNALLLARNATTCKKQARLWNALDKKLKTELDPHTKTVYAGAWWLSDLDFLVEEGTARRLTGSQRRKVLNLALGGGFDAEVGVNWDSLREAYKVLAEEGKL